MRKIRMTLLLSAMLAFSTTAFADIPKEKIDVLSDQEKNILKSAVHIARIGKMAGLKSQWYSEELGEDLAVYSLDELKEMESYLSSETGDPDESGGLIGSSLCEYKLFSITVTDAEIRERKYSGNIDLVLHTDIVNDNDFSYEGYIDSASVNDWQVSTTGWFNVPGGKKQKQDLVLNLNDLGVESLDDIETLSISFKLLYADYAITTDEVSLSLK